MIKEKNFAVAFPNFEFFGDEKMYTHKELRCLVQYIKFRYLECINGKGGKFLCICKFTLI